ncbi:hypothetical protein GCM10011349_46340 [Novosphingobium indicum]|uniref:DUF1543 domain-containing protein n=1 Tax=Novosphingobium indicum TaxID=462949 RepID=A0ABQ2K1V6_9SPHN|nr:hypothetical protein [Novosphingobium indicum]GGN62551.1 hypothetical protein GCM10011349_46340 [Novosphingobium indicum]
MKLYVAEIGGMCNGSLFESHEVHALVAPDDKALVALCEERFGAGMQAAHLDGWIALELEPLGERAREPGEAFFAVELGRNSSAFVREQHDYRFLAARDWKDAAQIARKQAPGWHVDAVIDLDALALERGYALRRDLSGDVPEPQAQSCYVPGNVEPDKSAKDQAIFSSRPSMVQVAKPTALSEMP